MKTCLGNFARSHEPESVVLELLELAARFGSIDQVIEYKDFDLTTEEV